MNRKNLRKPSPMRTAIIILTLTAAAILLPAACSPLPDGEAASPVPKTLGVGAVTIDGTQSATRANTVLTSGTLWVGSRATTGYTANYTGATYTCTGGTWTASGTDFIILNSGTISLYACYPYYNGMISNAGKELVLTMKEYAENQEIYFATASKNTVNAANPKAVFELKHAYARFRVALSKSNLLTGSSACTTYSLGSADPDASTIQDVGTLNLTTGNVTTSSGTLIWQNNVNVSIASGAQNIIIADLLMVPQTVPANGFSISLIVDGSNKNIIIPQNKFGTSLESNVQYTIHLVMNADATISIGTVTLERWTTDDLGSIIHPIE